MPSFLTSCRVPPLVLTPARSSRSWSSSKRVPRRRPYSTSPSAPPDVASPVRVRAASPASVRAASPTSVRAASPASGRAASNRAYSTSPSAPPEAASKPDRRSSGRALFSASAAAAAARNTPHQSSSSSGGGGMSSSFLSSVASSLRPRASSEPSDYALLRQRPAYDFLRNHFPHNVVEAALQNKTKESIFLKEPTELQQTLELFRGIRAKDGITDVSSLSLSIFVPDWRDYGRFCDVKLPSPGDEQQSGDDVLPDLLSRTQIERDLQIRHLAQKENGAVLAHIVQPMFERRVVTNQRLLTELVGLSENEIRNLFLLTPESFLLDTKDLRANLEGWQTQISRTKEYLGDFGSSADASSSSPSTSSSSGNDSASSSSSSALRAAPPPCASLAEYLSFPHYSNVYVKHPLDVRKIIEDARETCTPVLHTSPEVLQRRLKFVAETFYPNHEARDVRVLSFMERVLSVPSVVSIAERQLQDTYLFLTKLWGPKHGRLLSAAHLRVLATPIEKLIVPVQEVASLKFLDPSTNKEAPAFYATELSHMFLKSPKLFGAEHTCVAAWSWLTETFDRPRDMVLQHIPLLQYSTDDHLIPLYSYLRVVGISEDVIENMPRLLSEKLEVCVRPRLEYLRHKGIPFYEYLDDRLKLLRLLRSDTDTFLGQFILQDPRVRAKISRDSEAAGRPLKWTDANADEVAVGMLKKEFDAFRAESRTKGLLPSVYEKALVDRSILSREALLGPSWVDQFRFDFFSTASSQH